MGIFDRFKKKKEPGTPYVSDLTPPYEEARPAPPPMPEGEDPFSEEVIAELEAEGFTINWRYGYRLANRYEVKRVCAGGQAVVFIVEDLVERGKRYAAKTLKAYFRKPETEAGWEDRGRSIIKFLEECNVWVDLGKHRHIVQAEYLEKITGVPLVMSEFIDGGSLDAWLEKGPLDMTTALDFAIQSCIGMEYANRKGVAVHRDIKPGNILVTRDGVAKINDFGIAKAVESAETIRPETEPYAPLDSASLFVSRGMGTPPYMAPEQFHEPLLSLVGYPTIPLGVETDIYAFGLVLYEMITGRLAVQIESDREAEIQRAVQHIVSIPGVNPGYGLNDWAAIVYCFLKTLKTFPPRPSRNEHLNAVILKCLAKEPGKRYHSFAELKTELTQIYREETGRTYHMVDEPDYEPNWRNRGKTCWILGREEEAFECYDKALEQNPADIVAWLEKGLSSAEAGDLAEFGLRLEITPYLRPSRGAEVQQYKKEILEESRVRLRDIRFFNRLASEYAVPGRVRDWVLSNVEEFSDPFREPNPTVSELLEQLRDEDFLVRANVAMRLGKLGDRSATPALIGTLKDEEVNVRLSAADALGELGDRSAIPALIEALKDEDSGVNWSATRALGRLGERSATPALIEALKDENPSARGSAAETLGELGDRSAVQVLENALKDEDHSVRTSAAEALGRLGDSLAVPALIEALKDEDDMMRGSAAEALGKLGCRSAIPALIEALKDEDPWVRRSAAWALGKLGGGLAVQALVNALKDADSSVLVDVAFELGELGDRSAIPALIEALRHTAPKEEDSAWLVRSSAAEALGKLGDGLAVPALIEAIKDESGIVRMKAGIALGKLGIGAAVQAFIEALRHKNLSAAEALGELGDRSAIPALIEAVASFPDPGRVLVALRRICSQPDDAKLSQMKVKLKEYSALEWNKRGLELLTIEDYEEALKFFEKAIEIDPDWDVPRKGRDEAQHWIAEMNFEWTLKDIKLHYDQVAVRRFDLALSKDPRNIAALVGKGEALIRLNRYEEAIRCFDMALEIDPRNADAWAGKAEASGKLSRIDEAIECAGKATEIDPDWDVLKKKYEQLSEDVTVNGFPLVCAELIVETQVKDGMQKRYPISRDLTKIGRSRDPDERPEASWDERSLCNDIILPEDEAVSRWHGAIRRIGDEYEYEDHSIDGTIICGTKLIKGEKAKLRHGDKIIISQAQFRFNNPNELTFEKILKNRTKGPHPG